MTPPRGLPGDYRPMHDELITAGFEFVGMNARNHYLYRRAGRFVTLPGSPGPRSRTFTNTRAAVRRAIRSAS